MQAVHRPPPTIADTLAEGALAVRRLLGHAGRAGSDATPRIVGITGPVGAGKSTLAAMLAEGSPAAVISTDHYLPDYDLTPEHLRDVPEAADLPRLLADLRSLKLRRETPIPHWCFQAHKRIGVHVVRPADLIIVEGLHALHPTHAGALDVRVYVDAPAATRWSRWEHLERTGVRGWGVDYARAFFDRVAEPTFGARAAQYRDSAHVVVINAGERG